MNKRDIKVLLETYYLKSLCGYNDDFYPIRVVEAVKSIIGINLDKNSNNILLWLENYMLEIEVCDYQFSKGYKDVPEVISYKNIKKNLLNKNKKKVNENLFYLSRVSDGSQIMEFLLEFSLQYSRKTLGFIWSIYRMEMFFSRQFVEKSLQICAHALMENLEEKITISNDNIIWKDYLVGGGISKIALYFSIFNTDLIRSEKIDKLVISRLFQEEIIAAADDNFEYIILDEQKKHDREWIVDYFENLSMDQITPKLIIGINNIRSCLKLVSKNDERLIFWTQLNKMIEKCS